MREEIVTIGEGSKYPLQGTLTLPDSEERCPAVLLIQGSGPTNRDEKIGVLTPFKDIAEYFAAKGIASLRFDKRTFVYSKEMKKDKTVTVWEEITEDAVSATELLKKDPRILSDKVFIAGHSLGGMLAPRIDAEGGDYAGIIIMAGSPRRLLDIMMEQNEAVVESLKGLTKKIAIRQVAKFESQLRKYDSLSLEESKNFEMFHLCSYYFKEMEAHPATDYLLKTEKRVLIIQGEKDFQVSAEKDLGGYQAILGNKANIEFRLYPGLNHLFTPSVYGNIRQFKKEYNVPAKFSEQVLEDLAKFILAS